jgi:hypothetical protein
MPESFVRADEKHIRTITAMANIFATSNTTFLFFRFERTSPQNAVGKGSFYIPRKTCSRAGPNAYPFFPLGIWEKNNRLSKLELATRHSLDLRRTVPEIPFVSESDE